MHLQTPKHEHEGFTLVELILVIGLILILASAALVYVKPIEQRQKSRDVTRLSNMESLDRAINEYRIDNGAFPDSTGLVRTSTSLPTGNTGPYMVCSDGWIDADFCEYISKLYVDPINDATYFYSYTSTTTSYELNAILEYHVDLMLNDGGDSDNVYELGNNKSLL